MAETFDPKTHYRCVACDGVFAKGWSDEEAAAEHAVEFPDMPLLDTDLVCDDCYKQILPFVRTGLLR